MRKSGGLSLTEIMISLSIAVMVMVPVMSMFSVSGQSVQKTRNFSFATSIARKISQHLQVFPFEDIQEVSLPGKTLYEATDDNIFNPFLNFSNDETGIKRISQEDTPGLFDYVRKYSFRYALSVSNVSFGDGDEIKSVSIIITWNESGKDMIYRSHVYINSI